MKLVSMHPVILEWRKDVEIQKRTLQQAQTQGDDYGAAVSIYNLASLYWQHYQWDEAHHNAVRALEQFRRLSKIHETLNTLVLLGYIYQAKEQLSNSEQTFKKAYDLAQQLDNEPVQAQILVALAGLYTHQGQTKQALENYTTALNLYRFLNDRVNEGYTLLSRGNYYDQQGEFTAAYQDYVTALVAFQDSADLQGQARSQSMMGNWQARDGMTVEAEENYEQAIQLFHQMNDVRGEAEARLYLASLREVQVRNSEAAQQYEKAVHLFQLAEDHQGEARALTAWESAFNVPGPPNPGDALEAIKAELSALGGRVGPGFGDPVCEERDSTSPVTSLVRRLVQLAPDTEAVLSSLQERGILHAKSEETGVITAQTLLYVLNRPRVAGLKAEDVYRYILEKLNNPHSNTQRINLSFPDGSEETQTCVSAQRIYILIAQKPGEFARIVEELTSPNLAFSITRTYPDVRHYRARIAFLQGQFDYKQVGKYTLSIVVRPDDNALPRALAEHAHRLYPDYDFFGERERSGIHVMLLTFCSNRR